MKRSEEEGKMSAGDIFSEGKPRDGGE